MNKFNLENVIINDRNIILQNSNVNQIQELININDVKREEQVEKINKIMFDLQNQVI